MTSYPITLPATPSIRVARWGLRSNTTVYVSALSRVQQVVSRPGQVWVCSIELPTIGSVADAAEWRASLLSLRGRQGTFYLGDPIYNNNPRGTAGGTPLVNGASQAGNTLVTDGWSAAATFLKGDYFTLGNNLHMLTENVTATGGGAATLTFEPTLRISPANNAALDISTPKAAFRLTSDESFWDENPGPFWGMTFDAVEAL